ncbi:MAG: hypothetical protein U1A24_10465 [Cypionkella sp.]|uniref:hypothetical protein n=1 Tax=Cypionkella sp. TaxID=2811411 RepID=UPI002AB93B07|nr:hypothetical protein [Cypionkella sp.]MDZ4310962.1 hypothetical protein [Cypionkella sp.]MDZ4395914.1 hypothetical protein [Cypionkella sp.]
MSRNPSVTAYPAKLAIQPIAAIRAAQEADAYFKASPLSRPTATPSLNALELMYAYYSD